MPLFVKTNDEDTLFLFLNLYDYELCNFSIMNDYATLIAIRAILDTFDRMPTHNFHLTQGNCSIIDLCY